MTGSLLPPLDPMPTGNRLELFKSLIPRIGAHGVDQFVCGAHGQEDTTGDTTNQRLTSTRHRAPANPRG